MTSVARGPAKVGGQLSEKSPHDADAAIDEIEQLIEDDPEAFFESDEDPFADVNERATEMGLVECGDEG